MTIKLINLGENIANELEMFDNKQPTKFDNLVSKMIKKGYKVKVNKKGLSEICK